MKVLVTAGATREPIDAVRFITNFSTGRTGAMLSEYFSERGHQVTHLCGQGTIRPRGKLHAEEFGNFTDLDGRLRAALGSGKFDLIIHAAAVSDYSVTEVRIAGDRCKADTLRNAKIPSGSTVEVKLTPNFKIIDRLKSYCEQAKPIVVGFKLTCADSEAKRREAIFELSCKPSVDFVVHNDFKQFSSDGAHAFTVYRRTQLVGTCASHLELARTLEETLEDLR